MTNTLVRTIIHVYEQLFPLASQGACVNSITMVLDVIDGQLGIPIFIELRRLNENNDILNEVAIQLGGLNDGFDKEILETLFVDGEFIFFFDGYDEISSSNKAFVTRNIQDFVAKASNNKYKFYIYKQYFQNFLVKTIVKTT